MSKNELWYTRRGSEAEGPFPSGQISRYLLLGRLKEHDEVSQDKNSWSKIASFPELIPEVLKADLTEPENRERLEAARRWADERREAVDGDELAERRHAYEPEALTRVHRETKTLTSSPGTWSGVARVSLYLSLAAALVLAAIYYTPDYQHQSADCQAAPAPGVIWNNCQLEGLRAEGADLRQAMIQNANLSGASLSGSQLADSNFNYTNLSVAQLNQVDLQHASLVGSRLRNSELRGADLRGADLSYANLSGANIDGAKLEGAKLSHAIWIDGHLCSEASVGECQVVQAR